MVIEGVWTLKIQFFICIFVNYVLQMLNYNFKKNIPESDEALKFLKHFIGYVPRITSFF